MTNFVENTACKLFTVFSRYFIKSALIERFFVSALLIFVAPISALSADSLTSVCSINKQYTDTAQVRYVIDGDTVVLENGKKVRLIGIDTPELGHGEKTDQPGALAAREYLQQRLMETDGIKLLYDSEQHDRHGRMLAHLFLSNGINLQAELLLQGLATPFTVPPNLAFVLCYKQQTEKARKSRLGVWALDKYQAKPANSLNGTERGYHIINGEITRIGESRTSVWLNFEEYLAIRILRSDLQYFDTQQIKHSHGKTAWVQGHIYQQRGQLRMRLRHQVDLDIK